MFWLWIRGALSAWQPEEEPARNPQGADSENQVDESQADSVVGQKGTVTQEPDTDAQQDRG